LELSVGVSVHRECQRIAVVDVSALTPRDLAFSEEGKESKRNKTHGTMSGGGPMRTRALARALTSRPLHTSGTKDKAAQALNLGLPSTNVPQSSTSSAELPFFARFVGAILDVALTPAQARGSLDASGTDPGFAASGVHDIDAHAAVAAVRRERDAALDRVADLESATANLRASVTKLEGKTWSDSDQMQLLKTQLWQANQDAADARVALNAVREDLKLSMRREQDLAVRIVDVKDEAVADVTARAKAEFEALRESMEDKRASLLASVECKVAKLDAAEAKSRGLEAALMDAQAKLATSAPVVQHPLYGSMLRDFGYKKNLRNARGEPRGQGQGGHLRPAEGVSSRAVAGHRGGEG